MPLRDWLVAISLVVNTIIGSMVFREFLKLRRAVADLCDVVNAKRRIER